MYCTIADIKQIVPELALIQLTNDDPGTLKADEAIIKRLSDEASSLCDGYLLSRYALPLNTVPVLLRQCASCITRYYLYQRQPESPVPDAVKSAYDSSLSTLEQIQRGAITLDIDVKPAVKFKVKAPNKRFSDEGLTKW